MNLVETLAEDIRDTFFRRKLRAFMLGIDTEAKDLETARESDTFKLHIKTLKKALDLVKEEVVPQKGYEITFGEYEDGGKKKNRVYVKLRLEEVVEEPVGA